MKPTTSCELRQWWARARLVSVTMTWLDGAVRVEVAVERAGVADQFAAVDESGRRGVDHPVAVARHHHDVVLGADHRDRIVDGHELDGRDRLTDARIGHRLLVDHLRCPAR